MLQRQRIPSAVIAPIDVAHLRKTLADAGFTVGGFYLGETFGNTGGIHQGENYDGVLWTYLLGDLHKAGLWKASGFYADAYQIHGRSITADNIGSLAIWEAGLRLLLPRSYLRTRPLALSTKHIKDLVCISH